MLEAILLAGLATWLLAAATHRFRRESGVTRPGQRAALRWAAAALVVASAACCGSTLSGEWCVRFLAVVSIAAAGVVLALSVSAATLFRPLRRISARGR